MRLVKDAGRRGDRSVRHRECCVDAILFLAQTGCQWRYLPDFFPPWPAVWPQCRRWQESGVWARDMMRLAAPVRVLHGWTPIVSGLPTPADSAKDCCAQLISPPRMPLARRPDLVTVSVLIRMSRGTARR